jgi:hypothetical protein
MMRNPFVRTALAAAAMALMPSLAARAQAPAHTPSTGEPVIDPKADKLMHDMATFLAGVKRFRLEAEETFDLEMARAYRVQLTNVRTLTVERPSRFVADATGDTLHRSSWFDGRTLTVLNKQKNVYAAIEAPGTIDAVLDKVAEEYQVLVPLSDLLYSDPYSTLMDGVLYGKYLGIHQAAGVPCHHLTFGQEGLYWQIWIDAGDKPWPRKLAVASWEDPGVPRYEAVMRRWVADPPTVDGQFVFKAPAGARQVQPAELARTAVATSSSGNP